MADEKVPTLSQRVDALEEKVDVILESIKGLAEANVPQGYIPHVPVGPEETAVSNG